MAAQKKPGDALLGPGLVLLILGVAIAVAAPQAFGFAALLFALGLVLALIGRAVSYRATN